MALWNKVPRPRDSRHWLSVRARTFSLYVEHQLLAKRQDWKSSRDFQRHASRWIMILPSICLLISPLRQGGRQGSPLLHLLLVCCSPYNPPPLSDTCTLFHTVVDLSPSRHVFAQNERWQQVADDNVTPMRTPADHTVLISSSHTVLICESPPSSQKANAVNAADGIERTMFMFALLHSRYSLAR